MQELSKWASTQKQYSNVSNILGTWRGWNQEQAQDSKNSVFSSKFFIMYPQIWIIIRSICIGKLRQLSVSFLNLFVPCHTCTSEKGIFRRKLRFGSLSLSVSLHLCLFVCVCVCVCDITLVTRWLDLATRGEVNTIH